MPLQAKLHSAPLRGPLGRVDLTEKSSVLITLGWAALAATFTFSIAMVVCGRNGDGSINF